MLTEGRFGRSVMSLDLSDEEAAALEVEHLVAMPFSPLATTVAAAQFRLVTLRRSSVPGCSET